MDMNARVALGWVRLDIGAALDLRVRMQGIDVPLDTPDKIDDWLAGDDDLVLGEAVEARRQLVLSAGGEIG